MPSFPVLKNNQPEPSESQNLQGVHSQEGSVVCIFCGHLPGDEAIAEKYRVISQNIVRALVQKKITILTGGGGGGGIMTTVTQEALDCNGKTIQVIPDFLLKREGLLVHSKLNTSIVVDSMEERKHVMLSKSNAFILLYGGIGSLDEFFEVITAMQLGVVPKNKAPLIVFNQDNYWTPLQNMLSQMIKKGFLPEKDQQLFSFCQSIDECVDTIAHITDKPPS